MPRISSRMTRNARALRNYPTRPERIIWRIVSAYRPRFTRQLPVGPYIIDLACRTAKLAVEFDGSQHAQSTYDAQRSTWLQSLGWRVERFWNSQVRSNPQGVAEEILKLLAERLPPGAVVEAIPPRAGRERKPRTRKQPPTVGPSGTDSPP